MREGEEGQQHDETGNGKARMGADEGAGRAVVSSSEAERKAEHQGEPQQGGADRAETGGAHAGLRQPLTQRRKQRCEARPAQDAVQNRNGAMRRRRLRPAQIGDGQPHTDQHGRAQQRKGEFEHSVG
jgi:hypothetical protein